MYNQYNQQPNYNQYGVGPMPIVPEEYKPISAWGYFGYEILFSIPVIGFIFLLIFALGGTRNINLKNFARSYFCVLIICIVFLAIAFALGGFAYLGSTTK